MRINITTILRWSIFGLVFLLPFGPKFASPVGNIHLTSALLVPIIILWLLSKLVSGKHQLTDVGRALFWFVLAYLSLMVIHLLRGAADLAGILRAFQFAEYTFIYFIVVDVFKTKRQIKKLVYFFLGMVFLESVVAIIYYHFPWRFIDKFYTLESTYFSNQMVGTFSGEHNLFTAYLLMGIFILLGFIFKLSSIKKKLILFTFSLPLFYCWLFSMSRTAYLILMGGLATLFFLDKRLSFIKRFRRGTLITILIILLAASLFSFTTLDYVQERVFSIYREFVEQGVSLAGRTTAVWRVTKQVFSFEYPFSSLFGFGSTKESIHNSYIKIFYQAGFIGFFFFLSLCFVMFKVAWVSFQKSTSGSPFEKSFFLGFLTALIACFFVYSLAVPVISLHKVMGNFWIFLGLVSIYSFKFKE